VARTFAKKTVPDALAGAIRAISERRKLKLYAASVQNLDVGAVALARGERGRVLLLAWSAGARPAAAGELAGAGDASGTGDVELQSHPASFGNAHTLGKHLPHLAPRCKGLATALGLGDRLGLGTPGHIEAVRGTGLAPFLAQQSIREMTRTARSPEDVMRDAVFGALQAGWAGGFGSDADHLKSSEDIDRTLAAGFTMFTIDPGDHVDATADAADASQLREKVARLPWDALDSSEADAQARYAGREFTLAGGGTLAVSEEAFARAAAKYGRAVAHTARMYRHLVEVAGARPFELEVSVDETESPTTPEEHWFVASELARLEVKWVSLAPRYVGRFEKGVDFIGDLDALRASLVRHAAVARTLGPYKLGIHSGSDKFSVYPIAAELADGLVHVKTAGTSYLEALRVLARRRSALFREIFTFARERYEEDKRTYHVSADLAKVPEPSAVPDAQLDAALDRFDDRQVLHVTFGSVLTAQNADGTPRFRARLLEALLAHEDDYAEALRKHLGRHAAPFATKG